MEKEKSPQWIFWFVLIQLFLLGNAMLHRMMKLTTNNAPPDYISIDCGADGVYNDPQTTILYQTDGDFVETGMNSKVAAENKSDVDYPYFGRQMQTLRYFPEGKRNCYSLKLSGKNNNYFVRALFAYGNYDGKNKPPTFDLYLNVDLWTTVVLDDDSVYKFEEIIHTPTTDTIQVCLVNAGRGIPFISTLELRPLANSIYNLPQSPSQSLLALDSRVDVGSNWSVDFKRFEDDNYDRVWRLDDISEYEGWQKINMSSEDIDFESVRGSSELPKEVVMSATRSLNLSFALCLDYDSVWDRPSDSSVRYFVIFHFVEIEQLTAGQKRVIDITVNGKNIHPTAPITLEYLKPVTVPCVTDAAGLRFNISAASESDAPPILNAIETYRIISPTSPTDQTDADAIVDIRKTYKIRKADWQGDPCVPTEFLWEGLRCSYGIRNARITALNLSASKLRGEIAPSFSKLTELESLDLSCNDLSGSIPEFLAELPNLRNINLSGNRLTGSVPEALKERPGLEIRLTDPSLCLRDPSKRHKFLIPLIASVSALSVVILISLGIWIFKMKKLKVDSTASTKQEALKYLRNRAISYSEVLEITNNFENMIGQGGFGKVYAGTLKNNTQVAVKLLSASSMQGHRAFRSEVEVLMVVHHRHLVSLIGYCEENGARALIYEYVANSDLHQHLIGRNAGALKWKDRLQIGLDAAHGLDYLHNGCKPAIVHRDLKASNILLDENMEAKIADFGLSRVFANDIDTHVSTRPAGTFGYLDPEFQISGNLTKGSDIYSFGIILLELITGKPAAKRLPDNSFSLLLQWVTLELGSKDVQSIMDPRLQGQYSTDSARKFLEIAISCTAPSAIQRPDISQVVVELRECLAMEISFQRANQDTNSSSSMDLMSNSKLDSEFSVPSAR